MPTETLIAFRVSYMTTGYGAHAVGLIPSEYQRLLRSGYMTVRYRSRGKHSPGSGPYTCLHASRTTIPRSSSGYYVLYPGCYYEDDTNWAFGEQWYCSFDCIGTTYRYLKAVWASDHWELKYASGFVYDGHSGSYYGAHEVLTVTNLSGFRNRAEPPRTTNVNWVPRYSWGGWDYPERPTVYLDSFQPKFNLGEMEDALMLVQPVAISNLIANAYVDAIAAAPTYEVNNIGNILSVMSLIKSLMAGPEKLLAKGMAKSLADAWLQYRYVYQTTSTDIRETAEFFIRSAQVKGNNIHCNGIATLSTQEAKYIARCSVTLHPEDYDDLQSEVERFGLALSAYNAWDLVPWSFIADWFLHIGDRLEFYDKRNRALKLNPGTCWYSLTKEFFDKTTCANVSFYHRWPGGKPDSSGCFVGHPASNTTIVKRAIDVWALSR